VVRPDVEVVHELESFGAKILRTDEHDAGGCDVPDRVGVDDGLPGGCDNWVLEAAAP
jgi:hypothetical protein